MGVQCCFSTHLTGGGEWSVMPHILSWGSGGDEVARLGLGLSKAGSEA